MRSPSSRSMHHGPELPSERQVESMAQTFLHLEKKAPAAKPEEAQPFTIAISRDSGANGHLIARAVGARLNWPVYDQELLRRIADDMGLPARMLESLDEKRTNWLQESVAGFITSVLTVDSGAYVHHLVETLFTLAAQGDCVILGRGAAQVLPAKTTLRVRLIGPSGGQDHDDPAATGRQPGGGGAAGSHKPTTTGVGFSWTILTRIRRTLAITTWSSIRRGWASKPAPNSSSQPCSACGAVHGQWGRPRRGR